MNNLRIWEQVKQPPKEALKTIGGGRLKNFTDITPQWRMEKMTELFGPIGIGWGYEITKMWTEQGALSETFAFATISLWYMDGETRSMPVPGIGGSKLIEGERGGLHNNDEAYKMAVTDALSVALKALGVGSDVYWGRWDGSKYRDAPQDENPEPKKPSDFETAKAATLKHLYEEEAKLTLGKPELFRQQIDSAKTEQDLRVIWTAIIKDAKGAEADAKKAEEMLF